MTNDAALAEKVIALRAFGRSVRNDNTLKRSSAFGSQTLSSNYRLSEFQAAVLLAQLDKFPHQDERRQANAARLTRGLAEIPGIRPIRREAPSCKHGYYYFLVRYEPGQFGNFSRTAFAPCSTPKGSPFFPVTRNPFIIIWFLMRIILRG